MRPLTAFQPATERKPTAYSLASQKGEPKSGHKLASVQKLHKLRQNLVQESPLVNLKNYLHGKVNASSAEM